MRGGGGDELLTEGSTVAAAGASTINESMLFEGSALDAWTYLLTVLVVLTIALTPVLIPP